MANDRIQIARGSLELGVLSLAEARELLGAGFLLPTDLFRAEENQEWRPLGELIQATSGKAGPLARMKGAAAQVGSSATRAAANFVSMTGRGSTAIGATASRLLEDYIPRIRESVRAAVARSAGAIDSKLQDEIFLRKTFGTAYDTLPKPVYRFVSEDAFIEFCFKRRSKLLGKKD